MISVSSIAQALLLQCLLIAASCAKLKDPPLFMLEKQRDRKRPVLEYRNFARNLMLVHFALGPVMTLLLLLHELFVVAGSVFLWFLLTIGLLAGMMRRIEWCRPMLGAMMVIFAGVSAVYITHVHPALPPLRSPLLDRSVLPLWGSLMTVIYFALGGLMLVSNRVKRATTLGFGLWG